MNNHTQYFFIQGTIGKLECAVDFPDNVQFPAPRALALVAHPHPLFGGTMDNKVTQTLARSFVQLGYIAVRMNFRGVGKSEGAYDDGRGETDDMAILLDNLRQRYPDLPIILGGFSFGTFVQAQLQQRLAAQGITVQQLVLVGTATSKWPIPEVPENTLLIHGESDEVIPLQSVFEWARPQSLPVIVISGSDHFFNRKLQQIKQFVIKLC